MVTGRRTFLASIATGLAAVLPSGKQAAASSGTASRAHQSQQGQSVLRVTLDLNRAADQQQVN
jgi:hypothetical protein